MRRVFICLDPEDGMLFNNRRQSRDRVVTADIEETVGSGPICMSACSAKLFEAYDNVCVRDQFDGCENIFLEDDGLDGIDFDELIVYRWDKVYPSDVKLTYDYKKLKLDDVKVLTGYSHDQILREVYVR